MSVIRRDVKELYAQNLFDDIRVDAEDGKAGGVVIVFTVKEKPLIRSVDFPGANSITRSDILDKLKEKKISISQESPYDPAKVKQVETVLKSMLAEKGPSGSEGRIHTGGRSAQFGQAHFQNR